MNLEAQQIIETLGLRKHPEGGFYSEVYRSPMVLPESALPACYAGARSVATHIYFLLCDNEFSAFHKLCSDEHWHFYKGSRLLLHQINAAGQLLSTNLGSDLKSGETPYLAIAANNWFAAELVAPDSYALLGCSVAPGFDFNDFTMAERASLASSFPQHAELIRRLTR